MVPLDNTDLDSTSLLWNVGTLHVSSRDHEMEAEKGKEKKAREIARNSHWIGAEGEEELVAEEETDEWNRNLYRKFEVVVRDIEACLVPNSSLSCATKKRKQKNGSVLETNSEVADDGENTRNDDANSLEKPHFLQKTIPKIRPFFVPSEMALIIFTSKIPPNVHQVFFSVEKYEVVASL